MKQVVRNWTSLDPFRKKQKLEEEGAVAEASSHTSLHSAAEHVVAHPSAGVFDPDIDCCWYVGQLIDPLYLRKCVKDLASAITQQFRNPKTQGAYLYVMIVFTYIPGSINPADILSKHWSYLDVWKNVSLAR
jgi:hypothetical protein